MSPLAYWDASIRRGHGRWMLRLRRQLADDDDGHVTVNEANVGYGIAVCCAASSVLLVPWVHALQSVVTELILDMAVNGSRYKTTMHASRFLDLPSHGLLSCRHLDMPIRLS